MQLVCVQTGDILLTAADVAFLPIGFIENYLNVDLDKVEWQHVD